MTHESEDRSSTDSANRGDPTSAGQWIVLMVALSTMLAPLNSTMIAVALPNVMAEFNVGVAGVAWLVTAYLAAMASLQPLAGKIGDRLGRPKEIH